MHEATELRVYTHLTSMMQFTRFCGQYVASELSIDTQKYVSAEAVNFRT